MPRSLARFLHALGPERLCGPKLRLSSARRWLCHRQSFVLVCNVPCTINAKIGFLLRVFFVSELLQPVTCARRVSGMVIAELEMTLRGGSGSARFRARPQRWQEKLAIRAIQVFAVSKKRLQSSGHVSGHRC